MRLDVSSYFFLWVTLATPPQLCTWVNGSGANLSPCSRQKKEPQTPHQQNPKSQRGAKQGIQAKTRQAILTNLRRQQASPTSCVRAWWTNPTSLWRRSPGRRYWKNAALTCPSPSWERSRRIGEKPAKCTSISDLVVPVSGQPIWDFLTAYTVIKRNSFFM